MIKESSLLKNLSDPITQFNAGIKMIISSYETQTTIFSNEIDKLKEDITKKDLKIKQLEEMCNNLIQSKNDYENKISILNRQIDKMKNKFSSNIFMNENTKNYQFFNDNDDSYEKFNSEKTNQKINKNLKLDFEINNFNNKIQNNNKINYNSNYSIFTNKPATPKNKLTKNNSTIDKDVLDIFNKNNYNKKKKYFDEFDNYLTINNNNNNKLEPENNKDIIISNTFSNNKLNKTNRNNSYSSNIKQTEKKALFTPDVSTIPSYNNNFNKYKLNNNLENNDNSNINDFNDISENETNCNENNNNFFDKCKLCMTPIDYSNMIDIVHLFNSNKLSKKDTYENITMLLNNGNYHDLINDFNLLFK